MKFTLRISKVHFNILLVLITVLVCSLLTLAYYSPQTSSPYTPAEMGHVQMEIDWSIPITSTIIVSDIYVRSINNYLSAMEI